jgi:hypothetical protein
MTREKASDRTRHARITTSHADSQTARIIANAIAPDNTSEMDTRVDGEQVVTTITRETTGGLQSNVDDYVVNLQVAAQLCTQDREPSTHANGSFSTNDRESNETDNHTNS